MNNNVKVILLISMMLSACNQKAETESPNTENVTVYDSADSIQTDDSSGTSDFAASGDLPNQNRENANNTSENFEAYEVSVDNKSHAALDLKSNPDASNFKTRLTEAYKSDTANFAGHYTFVQWGCGTSCQSSLIIDRQSGKIYNSPQASAGYDFRNDSRLLIVNPFDENANTYASEQTSKYLWDEKSKSFITQ